jgi:alkylation response protein AidB-like acyl-CoA dehydrogenase
LTLFLVDSRTKGIETERTVMVDSHNAARISFDNVEVNADGVLGEVDQGHQLLEGVLNIGRGAVASEMVGSAKRCSAARSLSQGAQAVRQSDRRIPGAAASRRAALYRHRDHPRRGAEGAADAGRDLTMPARRGGGEGARRLDRDAGGQEGVQMHGGMGMTDQFDIGFFMKRARVCQELFGDSNFHADHWPDEELLSICVAFGRAEPIQRYGTRRSSTLSRGHTASHPDGCTLRGDRVERRCSSVT